MTIDTASTKQSVRRWLVAILVVMVPLALCLSVALWAELAPHYISLESINPPGGSEWSPVNVALITRNENRFSIWSSEATICTAQSSQCQGNTQAEITQQVANWFVQRGWKTVLRDPATGWNICDNMGIVQKRSDLVFEQQGGMYYKPTACAALKANSTTSTGFTIYVTTINPSPFTSWSD